MVLADTSVWIDYLNGRVSRETELLDKLLIEGRLAIGDLIILEILQGIRDDGMYEQVKSRLSLLDTYTMFSPDAAIICSESYRILRKKGITIRKTTDVIIACFCIKQRIPLLYHDRDFKPFIQHLGLQSAFS